MTATACRQTRSVTTSPTFGGFSVSASWGEDDFWDVAARYAGEMHDFKIAVAAAYSENSDFDNSVNMVQPPGSNYFQIGAYIESISCGLFAYGAYGHLSDPEGFGNSNFAHADANNTWYAKAGIRQRWHPLGHTIFYGEYERAENNALAFSDNGGNGTLPFDDFVGEGRVKVWGLGVVRKSMPLRCHSGSSIATSTQISTT